MKDISKMTNDELVSEHNWLDNYLDEVISRKDVLQLELMEREMERRGIEVEEAFEIA